MHYFLIDEHTDETDRAVIAGSDARHIHRVLRMGPGDRIGLMTTDGVRLRGRIRTVDNARVEVHVEPAGAGTAADDAESPLQIVVAQAYLKDRKMDLLVRQMTEIGVRRWLPVFSRYCVPIPDRRRLQRRRERWQTIAREALKQCRRNRVPDIGEPVTIEAAVAAVAGCDVGLMFWEDEQATRLGDVQSPPAPATVGVLLGPEGGFGADEVALARRAGLQRVSLGPRILRAETAAVAACSLVQYRWGDMGFERQVAIGALDNHRSRHA